MVLFGYTCHMLMAYLLSLCLMLVGIYLYLFSNQVLIKFDQLKMLNAHSQVHYKAFAFISFLTLAKYDKCSLLCKESDAR
jgi:hypothetical protein